MHGSIYILLYSPTADADRSNEVPIRIEDRLTSTEHHKSSVGLLYSVQIATWLGPIQETVRGEEAVEVRNRLRLLDADVHAAEVRVVHAQEGHELRGRIKDGDVVRHSCTVSISHLAVCRV